MKTILCPIDHSANSAAIYKYAAGMAEFIKAKIILFHSFETPAVISEVPFTNLKFDYNTLREAELNRLQHFLKRNSKAVEGIKTELMVSQGLPSSKICEAALEKKADLIIMGTTGTSIVSRILHGSNTARVIHNAPCMVLAVPHHIKFKKISGITYATDLSDDSLDHAGSIAAFAKIFDAHILFLHVNKTFDTASEVQKAIAESKIKNHTRYPKISVDVVAGTNISKGIDHFLKHHKSDCLAMFTHHRRFLSDIFKKSITSEISYHSTLPLLVVHENN